MTLEPITWLDVGAVRDAAGTAARPGAIAIAGGRIVAAGDPDAVRAACRGRPIERRTEHPAALVVPGLVNAHAHLDLSRLGPQPMRGSFTDWVAMVIERRPSSPEAIAAAVRHGLVESRRSGVGWLADIAASDHAIRARLRAGADAALPGWSFLECVGMGASAPQAAADAGRRADDVAEELAGTASVAIGLQPHAPYSAGAELYAAAIGTGRPIASTHLAETRDELEFVRDATGPFAELLRRLGKWDPSIVPTGATPIAHLAPALRRGRWIVAHANYLDDRDIELLRTMPRVAIAYCPIASEYFGHRDHRYRELLAAGVEVCLGTDSILAQPPGERQPFGILAQMRRLYRRDRTEPGVLLAMATTHGARALGCDALAATLLPGAPARLASVEFAPDSPRDPLAQVLIDDAPASSIAP